MCDVGLFFRVTFFVLEDVGVAVMTGGGLLASVIVAGSLGILAFLEPRTVRRQVSRIFVGIREAVLPAAIAPGFLRCEKRIGHVEQRDQPDCQSRPPEMS